MRLDEQVDASVAKEVTEVVAIVAEMVKKDAATKVLEQYVAEPKVTTAAEIAALEGTL